jgi:hypothetical protein
MADADSKACRVCGHTLPLEQFHGNPSYSDGRASICRSCHNRQSNERYHRTKVLKPLSPTQECAHCGKEFPRPQPGRPGDPPRSSVKHCSAECRFWSKVDKSGGPDACWNWMAKSRSHSGNGYGNFNYNGKAAHAHRVAWELTNGPIPNGLFGCHKCDNPLCCNPAHLFLGTAKDNSADMHAKGRHHVSPEGRERTRLAKIGKPRPPEVREKLRQASLKNAAMLAAMNIGRKRSEETKQRMRDAWVKRKERSGSID